MGIDTKIRQYMAKKGRKYTEKRVLYQQKMDEFLKRNKGINKAPTK